MRLSSDSQGFVAVVEEEQGMASEESRGSSSVGNPWERVGELVTYPGFSAFCEVESTFNSSPVTFLANLQ